MLLGSKLPLPLDRSGGNGEEDKRKSAGKWISISKKYIITIICLYLYIVYYLESHSC